MSDPTGTAGAPRPRDNGNRARLIDAIQQHERAVTAAITALQMVQKSLANLRRELPED